MVTPVQVAPRRDTLFSDQHFCSRVIDLRGNFRRRSVAGCCDRLCRFTARSSLNNRLVVGSSPAECHRKRLSLSTRRRRSLIQEMARRQMAKGQGRRQEAKASVRPEARDLRLTVNFWSILGLCACVAHCKSAHWAASVTFQNVFHNRYTQN